MNLVEEYNEQFSIGMAILIATEAHAGQTRKDNVTPYINHPLRVAQRILRYKLSTNLVIAALWHDVLEDCGESWEPRLVNALSTMPAVSINRILVMDIVKALTVIKHPNTTRARKQEIMIRQLQECPDQVSATFVKLCDRIDNLLDMDGMNPTFMNLYIAESEELLEKIRQAKSISTIEVGKRLLYELEVAIQEAKIVALRREMAAKVNSAKVPGSNNPALCIKKGKPKSQKKKE